MTARVVRGLCLMFAVVGTAFAEDTTNSLSFTQTNGVVYAIQETTKLAGPHYVIVTCWNEANTKKIHLEYIIFQNHDLCLKTPVKCNVKWSLKDVGVAWDNHKDFAYQIKEQVVRLKSEDIVNIIETLRPKK